MDGHRLPASTGRVGHCGIANGPEVLTVRAADFNTWLLRLPCLTQTLDGAQLRNGFGQFYLCLG